jgi:uncharacterized protein YodC (DUF2158 family)
MINIETNRFLMESIVIEDDSDIKELEIGDVVFLKSGGPLMMVTAISENDVKCSWISEKTGDIEDICFPAVCLRKVRVDIEKVKEAMRKQVSNND